jgi:hypothetical protein
MNAYPLSTAKRNLGTLLDKASQKGEIRIRHRNGQIFVIRAENTNKSPFEVKGINSDITREEIVKFVRKSRKR